MFAICVWMFVYVNEVKVKWYKYKSNDTSASMNKIFSSVEVRAHKKCVDRQQNAWSKWMQRQPSDN